MTQDVRDKIGIGHNGTSLTDCTEGDLPDELQVHKRKERSQTALLFVGQKTAEGALAS